jgi:hypothetical protein
MTLLEFTIMRESVHEKMVSLHKLYAEKYNPMDGKEFTSVYQFLQAYESAAMTGRITAISLVSYMELANNHWKVLRGIK